MFLTIFAVVKHFFYTIFAKKHLLHPINVVWLLSETGGCFFPTTFLIFTGFFQMLSKCCRNVLLLPLFLLYKPEKQMLSDCCLNVVSGVVWMNFHCVFTEQLQMLYGSCLITDCCCFDVCSWIVVWMLSVYCLNVVGAEQCCGATVLGYEKTCGRLARAWREKRGQDRWQMIVRIGILYLSSVFGPYWKNTFLVPYLEKYLYTKVIG